MSDIIVQMTFDDFKLWTEHTFLWVQKNHNILLYKTNH